MVPCTCESPMTTCSTQRFSYSSPWIESFSRNGDSSENGIGSTGPGSVPCNRPKARYTSLLPGTTTRFAMPLNTLMSISASSRVNASMSNTTSGDRRENSSLKRSSSRRSPNMWLTVDGRSAECLPRWNNVTWCPCSTRKRVVNGPVRYVPPRIRTFKVSPGLDRTGANFSVNRLNLEIHAIPDRDRDTG